MGKQYSIESNLIKRRVTGMIYRNGFSSVSIFFKGRITGKRFTEIETTR